MRLSLDLLAERLVPIRPEPALRAALEEVDLLETWLARQVERQLRRLSDGADLAALCHAWFGEQAASLFLQRRAGLEEVLLSVLQLSDGHLAQEFWFRLQAGEATFADLATHSLGPEREQGGRLGPLPMADLEPSLQSLLAGLQVGQLAPPLEQADGGVLLLRLEQRWPARLDAATRAALERELYEGWLAEQVAAQLQAGLEVCR